MTTLLNGRSEARRRIEAAGLAHARKTDPLAGMSDFERGQEIRKLQAEVKVLERKVQFYTSIEPVFLLDLSHTDPGTSGVQYRSMTSLAEEVCQRHDTNVATLVGASRNREIVKARAEFCVRALEECGRSHAAIGRFLGHRDPSTILWIVRKAKTGNGRDRSQG